MMFVTNFQPIGGAPLFVLEAETTWDTSINTITLTTGSFNVQAGDILVAFTMCETAASTYVPFNISDNAGGAISWTSRQEITSGIGESNYAYGRMWTAVADSNRSMTVTITKQSSAGVFMGLNVLVFRNSNGIGNSAKNTPTVTDGAPSLALTTTGNNSAIVVAVVDWNASDGASRTWRTAGSTITPGGAGEVTYFRNTSNYAVYGGYHADAGAAGAKTVGLSAPSNMRWSIMACEVLGR